MAGILEAMAVATTVFEKTDGGLAPKDIVKALGSKELALVRSGGSILKLLGNYIVEPVCVITKDLKEEDVLDSVVGLHTDMFTGFYMQAMDVLRGVHGLSDANAIDILATDNGGVGRVVLKGAEIALEERETDYLKDIFREDFKLTLGTEAAYQRGSGDIDDEKLDLEIAKHNYQKTLNIAKARLDADKDDKHAANAKNMEQLKHGNALERERQKAGLAPQTRPNSALSASHKDMMIPNALQRTIDITINRKTPQGGTVTVIIPIVIKTSIIYTDSEGIMNAISPNSEDKSFLHRLDDYRSSAVSFLDFIFANDLVKKYKHNKLKDKDELLKLLQSRKISANSKMTDSGVAGFEKFYTMYIISKPTAVKLESFLRGKFKSTKVKEKFLTQAYGFSLTVMDSDYERVQMHLKDLKGSTDLTFKGIVKKEKNGTDMNELVKALMSGKPNIF